MARPTLTDLEVEIVREKVCDAARCLFSKHGLEGVGLRTIGSEVGLTGAALYRYFPAGREEIVAAVRTRAFRELADLSEEAALSSGDAARTVSGGGRGLCHLCPKRRGVVPACCSA